MGIVIPASLIASSVKEFSFVENYKSPFPFIANTFFQMAGFCLFWTACIYFLSSKSGKRVITILLTFISVCALADTFLVPEKFGFLTLTMQFSEASQYPGFQKMVVWNLVLLLIIAAAVIFMFHFKKAKPLLAFQITVLAALTLYGISGLFSIHKDFTKYRAELSLDGAAGTSVEPVYKLSAKGRNIVLIMTDNFVSGFLPYIFGENPELEEVFSGWTYYPNTISFGNHTGVGALPIYGGYEYTPENINKRTSDPLVKKQSESYLLLPRLFSSAGFITTVTDPPFDNYLQTNLGIFRDNPEIHAENLSGKYTSLWLKAHPEMSGVSISTLLKRNLFYFSLFKSAPIFLRSFIYHNGDWLSTKKTPHGSPTNMAIDDYALLDMLPEFTVVEDKDFNAFFSIYEHLPHEHFFLQYPKYKFVPKSENLGGGPFAAETFYHVDTATLLLIANWISFLKENNAYDNTRIVIVSDHGRGHSKNPKIIKLPNGESLQSYNALLLVKDFNSSGEFKIDNTFMTNADTPLLLTEGILENPVNPFTGNPLMADKDNGVLITTIGALSTRMHSKNLYKIGSKQWMRVHDDIFDSKNWEAVEK
jgi:hypothetical protein